MTLEPNGTGAGAPKASRQARGWSDAPLKDVRVLDLTHFVAGPASTMALAFMGAEVIKVERPEPESSSMPPLNRLIVNTNKKSITLDLKSKAGLRHGARRWHASATCSSKTSVRVSSIDSG